MTPRRVIRTHVPDEPDPIVVRPGDRVAVGERYAGDPEWPDFYRCTHPDGRGGWVPGAVLAIRGDRGVARRHYAARELAVAVGEAVTVGEVLNGWAWCAAADGRSGWVPLRNLEPG